MIETNKYGIINIKFVICSQRQPKGNCVFAIFIHLIRFLFCPHRFDFYFKFKTKMRWYQEHELKKMVSISEYLAGY
jgi:hypothetical protein